MFTSVLGNVLVMLIYVIIGYLLCKSRLGSADHAKTLSGLLIYILGPCMVINSFLQTEYSHQTLLDIAIFFVTSLILQILFFLLLFLIFRKKFDNPAYRIMTVGGVLGNVGFFGLPLITGIFPDEPVVACYSSIYVMSMNIIVFTIGSYLITNDRKYISLKSALVNPTAIALLIAIPLFIANVDFPELIETPIALLGKMVTPICMIIMGMRLSAVDLKKLFTRKLVYLSCALKLIIYPLFAYACVLWIPFFSPVFKVSILALSACPTGAIVQSLGELYGCEQELTANVVLVSTFLCVITIPIITLLA